MTSSKAAEYFLACASTFACSATANGLFPIGLAGLRSELAQLSTNFASTATRLPAISATLSATPLTTWPSTTAEYWRELNEASPYRPRIPFSYCCQVFAPIFCTVFGAPASAAIVGPPLAVPPPSTEALPVPAASAAPSPPFAVAEPASTTGFATSASTGFAPAAPSAVPAFPAPVAFGASAGLGTAVSTLPAAPGASTGLGTAVSTFPAAPTPSALAAPAMPSASPAPATPLPPLPLSTFGP